MKLTLYALCIFMLIGGELTAGERIEVKSKAEHQVEAGETIYAISKLYDVTVESLMIANKFIGEEYTIHPGDILNIPDENTVAKIKLLRVNCKIVKCRYHIVQDGETLFSIAQKYDNVNPELLVKWNELGDKSIEIGQELIVKIVESKSVTINEVKKMNQLWKKAANRASTQNN